MRGFTRALGVCSAAFLLVAHTWADVDSDEPTADSGVVSNVPTADFSCSFDGSNTPSGWISSWNGEAPTSAWVSTPKDRGFLVTSSIHPHSSGSTNWPNTGSYSLAFYGKLPTVTDDTNDTNDTNDTKLVVWGMGSKKTGVIVIEQTANGPQLEYLKDTTLTALVNGTGAVSEGYHLIVVTVSVESVENENSKTTFSLYVDGSQVGSSVKKTSTAVACENSAFQVGAVYGGLTNTALSAGEGIIVDEIRGYNSVLTTAQIETLKDDFPVKLPLTRTVTENSNWSASGVWIEGSSASTQAAPEAWRDASLEVRADATMTLNAAATVDTLTVDGSNKLIFAATGNNGLTTSSFIAKTNVDLSAVTATLGAVTIAKDKTLTVGNATTLSELAGVATSQVIYNLTGALADNATRNAAIQTFPGIVTFKATGSTGATLNYGSSAPQLNCKLVFDGGAHTLSYGGANSRLFGPAGTDTAPTLDVKSSTTLNFAMKDLSGWSATNKSPLCVVRVREDAIVNFQTISGGGTAYFNDRLVLDDGALVDIQTENNNFRLHGGYNLSAENAQIAMLGGETETAATIQGNAIRLPTNEMTGVTVAVGAKATLTIANAITVENNDVYKLGKVGDGTLILSGALASRVAIEANDGTVDLRKNRPYSLKLAAGAKVRVLPTADEIEAGSLSLTLASGSAELSKANLEVQGGTVDSVSDDGTVTFTLSTVKITLTDASQDWNNTSLWENSTVATGGNLTIDCSTLTTDATLVIPDSCAFNTVTIRGLNVGLMLDTAAHLGSVSLSGGTLTVNSVSGIGNMVNDGALVVVCATNQAYAGTISGRGSLTKRGEGYLLFSGSSANTYSGGTRIEEGRIGIAVNDTLGSGAITVAPAAEKFAGLWVNAANVEISKQITFGGEGTCQLYIPYSRTLSVGGTVGGSGTVELIHGDTSGTGKLLFKNTAVLACTESTVKWKIRTGMNLQWGNKDDSRPVAVGTTERIIGYSVTVDDGGQLTFHPGTATEKNNSTTNKYIFATPITLNGGTLYTNDGSYVISSLYVPVASNVKTNWGKGIVFKQFFGDGDLRVQAEAQTQAPYYVFQCPYNDTSANPPADAIWFTGKLTIASLVSGSEITEVYPDTESAFQKAYLYFETADKCALRVDGNRKIGALGGAAAAVTNSGSSACTVTITGAYTAEESETIAAFAGSFGGNLSLALAENAAFELSGTLGAVADDVATFDKTLTINANATLKLTSTTPHTFTGAISGTGTFTFSPAVTLTAASSTIDAKLAGTGALTIGDGTNAAAVTLSGQSNYTGATTVEAKSTLILANELTFTPASGTNPTYPIDIKQGGTVTLAQDALTYRSFQGAGDLVVTGTNAVLGIPSNASVEGGFAVTGNVAVNANAVLTVTSWTSNAVLSGASLQIAGEVKKGNYDFSLAVANGKSLSGTGTIHVPVSFANGAVIEARTDGAVTCEGTVTLPETGAVTVKATAYGAKVLTKSDLDVTKFALPTEAGWKTEGLFTEQDGTLYLVAKPTFTLPEGGSAMSDATARAIAELAAAKGNYGITTVAVQDKRVPEAVELFTDVMTVDGATATIAYDFGVSNLTISTLQTTVDDGALTAGTQYVLVCATVSNNADLAQNTASYATGTRLTLLNDRTPIDGVVEPTADEIAALRLTKPAGSRWLAVPMSTLFPENQKTGTMKLTVKAFK